MSDINLMQELERTFPRSPELKDAPPDAICLIAEALEGMNNGATLSPELLEGVKCVLAKLQRLYEVFEEIEPIKGLRFTALEISKFRSVSATKDGIHNEPNYNGIYILGTMKSPNDASSERYVSLIMRCSEGEAPFVKSYFQTGPGLGEDVIYVYTPERDALLNFSIYGVPSLDREREALGVQVGEKIIMKPPSSPTASTRDSPKLAGDPG